MKAGVVIVLTITLTLFCAGSWRGAVRAAAMNVMDIDKSRLFPFVVNPWDVSPDNATNVAHWLDKPAGKEGFVIAKDGSFYTEAGKRLRFLGVNICWGGAFPEHQEATNLARQLARFGINLVRFHDIERYEAPDGIWQAGAVPRRIDPAQLDKLDYFVAQLKENGIYVNFNLKVNRKYLPEEGFDAPGGQPVTFKGLDLFHPAALHAQRQYAKELLTHRNPYTGLQYINEPALAQIELVNEDSLFYIWQRGELDKLPGTYLEPLDQLWLAWLKERYGTTVSLRQAWGGAATLSGKGPQLVENGDFGHGAAGWLLLAPQAGAAEIKTVAQGPHPRDQAQLPALMVEVKSGASGAGNAAAATMPPQVAIVTQLALSPGLEYRISFWAKADQKGRRLTSAASIGNEADETLWREQIILTADWRQYSFKFRTPKDAASTAGRLTYAMPASGDATYTYWLAGVSIQAEGTSEGWGLLEGEGLETKVRRPAYNDFSKYTAQVRKDYIDFLYHTEETFFKEMYTYIKQELGARSLVAGTQVPLSPPAIQAQLDYVDVHLYWGHPQFTGDAWDSQNWYITNNTMVNAEGGTIAGLAGLRVAGKPYVLSEYNHPAPNTYGAEGFLLAGAYGAFQDWDGIVVFDWTSNRRYDAVQLTNYFNIKGHPLKLVTLPAVAAMFSRGDVSPGETVVSLPLSLDEQLSIMAERSQTSVVHRAWSRAMPALLPLTHRVERRLTKDAALAAQAEKDGAGTGMSAGGAGGTGAEAGTFISTRKNESDTGELQWDRSISGAGVVVVDAAKSKAVIGYGVGRIFTLQGLTLKPGPTLQNGWSAITYTVIEENQSGPVRALLTATGYCQNTGMQWRSPAEGRYTLQTWGSGPVLVEGVPAEVEIAVGKAVRVYALDAKGSRRMEVPVTYTAGDALAAAQFAIGPQYKTLWYEIEYQETEF
jgi:hypothetical protein